MTKAWKEESPMDLLQLEFWNPQLWNFLGECTESGEKWNNLRDCMAEKGVHFFGLCRDEREGELVGWNWCQKYKF